MDISPHVLVLCVFTAHTGFSVLTCGFDVPGKSWISAEVDEKLHQ